MDPIIVTGMHRSGTTLVSTVLDRIGIFMGARQDSNAEALFFQRLNVWLLESAGARWDIPQPWSWAIGDDDVRQRYQEYLRLMLRSARSASYIGASRYARGARLGGLRFPWGWKDPRNTLTLPVWLDIFGPRSKVIYVRRHGVDVARSLVTRHGEVRALRLASFDRLKRYPMAYWVRPKRGEFLDSNRCTTLEGAFSLWLEYAAHFDKIRVSLPNPVLDLVYEHVLEDPVGQVRRIADFCAVNVSDPSVLSVCGELRRERAFAHRSSAEDLEFARAHADALSGMGYE